VDRSQRHLLGLINDILNLSRIEAGRVQYDIVDVSLAGAVADLRPMIEPQLRAKQISWDFRDIERMPIVRADPDKLQQVLLNLLSNASKFTDPGGRVWLDVVVPDESTGEVFVRVADTGRGIPADKLESIFEPFTQVDSSHSRNGQGSGLGLSISRNLARGMGGDLRARSELGAGSVFTLTLPLAPGR
jgi:signal transduction histidine kinase